MAATELTSTKKCVGTINKLTNLRFGTQYQSEGITISICFPLSTPAGRRFRMSVAPRQVFVL